ncbi:hypothetical protein LINGRAHAP2_LOCUS139 [Linum grandiflorum]
MYDYQCRIASRSLRTSTCLGSRLQKKINLEIDSAAVISLLLSTGGTDLRHQACIEDFRQLIARNWTVYVSHTYREGNRVADLLVHHSHDLPFPYNKSPSFESY